jgi:hypothetical protein
MPKQRGQHTTDRGRGSPPVAQHRPFGERGGRRVVAGGGGAVRVDGMENHKHLLLASHADSLAREECSRL